MCTSIQKKQKTLFFKDLLEKFNKNNLSQYIILYTTICKIYKEEGYAYNVHINHQLTMTKLLSFKIY